MKIVTFAHRLEVGGTQVNAIDLAAGLRDMHGCDVVFFATPGPLVRIVQAKGLRFVPAPDAYLHPSPARMRALRDLVRAEKPDVIHSWDWWQCLDAYYSVHLPWRVPMLTTDMMMTLTRVLPKQVPTTFGTPEMVDIAREAGRKNVHLLLPPVDVRANAPGAVDCSSFRRQFGLDDGCVNFILVSRLDTSMKADSVTRAIDAVRGLGRVARVRLVIVGEGLARTFLQELVAKANAELGREAVLLTGVILDPRPAYAAADIVVGMGTSALRGLAFAKPVVVVGSGGFSALFDQTTSAMFLRTGLYGVGHGLPDNTALKQQLGDLLRRDRDSLQHLGRFGREFVERHFALDVVCKRLLGLLRVAKAEGVPLGRSFKDAIRTSAVYVRERRFLHPSRDKVPVDAVTESATAAIRN